MRRHLLLLSLPLLLSLVALGQAAPIDLVLDTSASEARFLIGENLLGRETVAVGRTDAVSGGLTADPEDLATLAFQPFVVDVSQLATDDNRRDGQIRNAILQTNRAGNDTVTFLPTEVIGLELPLATGGPVEFQLQGELTIKGVTRTVVFEMSLELLPDETWRGTAWTVVRLDDFGISVPRVPLVARVDEEVRLELDFLLVPG